MGAQNDEIRIGTLHLGVKTPTIERAGFRTLGDLRQAHDAQFWRIPSVGRQTVEDLIRNRDAFLDAIQSDGTVDWAGYCSQIGVPLIPAAQDCADGGSFLRCLPIFLKQLADHLEDEILATILQDRICQAPHSQRTLEEIANLTEPRLSRERIRQKERKLLGQIAGGLLNDNYDGLDIHFDPNFAHWWRIAADELSELDDIEVGTFIDVLSKVWSVPPAGIMEHLPAIVAIVTGDPQMTAGFRSATRINPKLYGDLPQGLSQLPLLKLRIGKSALRLTEAGIASVAEVIVQLKSGGLEFAGSTPAKEVVEHLNIAVGGLADDNTFDWETYRQALELPCLPTEPPKTAGDFVRNLGDVVEALLGSHHVTKRAVDIFKLRTGQDAQRRMTLQRTADTLKTHLPTVKREETTFLEWLNDVLVAREFWRLDVWLDGGWLEYWAEAEAIFDQAEDDYERFAENLAWRWRQTDREIRQAAPILWAVFTGYPDSRRSAYIAPVAHPVLEGQGSLRIRLRGFRRAH